MVFCWRVFAALVVALLPVLGSSARTDDTLQINGFEQTPTSLKIIFSGRMGVAKVVRFPYVLPHLDPAEIEKQDRPATATEKSVTITLNDEPPDREYSIVVFAGREWFELVRQSPQWLKNKFDFDKPDGYTILGRRSIGVAGSPVSSFSPLIFRGKPKVPIHVSAASSYHEVNLANALLNYLWQVPAKAGPTSTMRYSQFLEQSFDIKLSMIRHGQFAVMCSGMRDLFLHASLGVSELKARAVEALNYGRLIPDLINYSHSTAEIWVEALHKWVLFDPWLGIMVVNDSGHPVGVDELQRAIGRTSGLTVVPLMNELPRVYVRGDGIAAQARYRPDSTRLWEFSCTNDGCSPGFVEYFRFLASRAHALAPENPN